MKSIYAERTVAMAPEARLSALRVIAPDGLGDLYQALGGRGVAADRPDCAGFELSHKADDGGPPRYAFLGVRPCDLRAIAIQDRVLAQPGSRYAARREPGC